VKLKIEITMDNEAFEGYNGDECARILHNLASWMRGVSIDPGDEKILVDYNGNKVGKAEVTDD